MTVNVSEFIGKRLIEARCARGLSATDLAGLVGISVVSLSKYENGHLVPKIDIFHKIASALNMPRPYFFRQFKKIDEKPIFWRGRLSVPPRIRERAGTRLEWMKEIIDYLANYFDFPALNIPDIKIQNLDSIGFDELNEIAGTIRSHWGIRPGPMPDVLEKLETNGILVSRIYMGVEKLDAFSQWSDRFNIPFVVLSKDKDSAVRQRFDALHELSHIVLHKMVTNKRLNDRSFYKTIEQQADRLACCLLLPEREFVDELYAPSLDSFLSLKERWGASVGAMIMRCGSLDIIDEDESKRMWINYARRGWRNNEPLDNKIEKETPHMIKRGFEMLISEKIQSISDILEALPFPVNDLEELADLEQGSLNNKTSEHLAPILKEEYKNEASKNVIYLFGKKDN